MGGDAEAARLAAVRATELLDTPPEPGFDDLAKLAALLAGTPIALVGLIDERRIFYKARFGIDLVEVPREESFCAHAIEVDELLVIEDARVDGRFAANRFVTGDTQVRFYAGAPLITSAGYKVGAICVVDRTPRVFDAQSSESLRLLARQCADQIELRAKARALERSEARSRAFLQGMPDVMIVVDRENVIRDWYMPSMYRAAIPIGDNAVGMHAEQLLAPEVIELVGEARRTGKLAQREIHVVGPNGAFDREVRVIPSAFECVLIVRDITERKELERMKDEFVSTVSHELRTPLTSIRGALGLLEGGVAGELPNDARELVTIARSSSDRLIRLVNDILDLEKLESGRVTIQRVSTLISDLLAAAIDNVRVAADARGIAFDVTTAPAERVVADPDRIVQVLTNLIANAVKFSPDGARVEIDVESIDGYVRFCVRDHGSGIAESDRDRLFRRFQQLDGSDRRKHGGTGLGLAIAKAIVELHRGRIGVEPAKGGGSVFWFELPIA